MESVVRLRRGSLRFSPAGLTLARPGDGWLLGIARLRYVVVRRVRFALWYWLGGLITCYALIGIIGNSLNPVPAWGGLLAGVGLLTWGLRGAWQLSVHLDDEAEPRHAWLYGADDAALARFEDEVNDYLRAQAELRRLAAEAEAASQAAAAHGTTSSTGGASFWLGPPPLPSPYPPSLLPGILP